MFHFRLISLTMSQLNVLEPACYAVAFFASPLSASECGHAKQRTVASVATIPSTGTAMAGQWRKNVTRGNPTGETLAGGTSDGSRSEYLLDYALSGGNDQSIKPMGIARADAMDVFMSQGLSQQTDMPQGTQAHYSSLPILNG